MKKLKYLLLFCFILITSVLLWSSYIYYIDEKSLETNETIGPSENLYFAIYVDDMVAYSIPSSSDGYAFSSGTCTNGATITWNNSTWTASVNFSAFNNNDNVRTQCTLNFETATFASSVIACGGTAECIETYASMTDELVADDTSDKNIRYIGSNPNNYIDIGNNVLWRIIGIFEVDDETGNTETRLKVIRSESIGDYSWDTSDSSVNSGRGVNEWSESDLMKLLNDGYTEEDVGGSLYWNTLAGYCYSEYNNETTDCNFSSSGLSTVAQEYFDDAVWNTGSNGSNDWTEGLANHFYEYERSSDTGKICTSGGYCNDTVTRTTSWTGKLALIYPSDYGYATSGGSVTDRDTCLSTYLNSWNSYSDCYSNDWLYTDSPIWTLMPSANSYRVSHVFLVDSNGNVYGYSNASTAYDVFPTGYLSASVTITDGDGSENNPFILSGN